MSKVTLFLLWLARWRVLPVGCLLFALPNGVLAVVKWDWIHAVCAAYCIFQAFATWQNDISFLRRMDALDEMQGFIERRRDQ